MRTEMKCERCGGFSSARICWPCTQYLAQPGTPQFNGLAFDIAHGLRPLPGCMMGPSEPCEAFIAMQKHRDNLLDSIRIFLLHADKTKRYAGGYYISCVSIEDLRLSVTATNGRATDAQVSATPAPAYTPSPPAYCESATPAPGATAEASVPRTAEALGAHGAADHAIYQINDTDMINWLDSAYFQRRQADESYLSAIKEVSRLKDINAELLEALQDALQTASREFHPWRPWHDQARAAIKKATD